MQEASSRPANPAGEMSWIFVKVETMSKPLRQKSISSPELCLCKKIYIIIGGKSAVRHQKIPFNCWKYQLSKTFPPQRKQNDRDTGRTDTMCVWSHSEHDGMSSHRDEEDVSSSKPTLSIIFSQHFIFFCNDDLFSFYTDTIQSKSQIHFKIVNRLSQTLQFPQNIGWTIKALCHILLICMYFL